MRVERAKPAFFFQFDGDSEWHEIRYALFAKLAGPGDPAEFMKAYRGYSDLLLTLNPAALAIVVRMSRTLTLLNRKFNGSRDDGLRIGSADAAQLNSSTVQPVDSTAWAAYPGGCDLSTLRP